MQTEQGVVFIKCFPEEVAFGQSLQSTRNCQVEKGEGVVCWVEGTACGKALWHELKIEVLHRIRNSRCLGLNNREELKARDNGPHAEVPIRRKHCLLLNRLPQGSTNNLLNPSE